MSKKYHIDIDSYLGDWGISKRYIKRELENRKDKEVIVRINSLGGSLDHGLDIAEQFAQHGNVTVEMFAFNASAATLASLGAKKIRISSSAFYLIHKVMNWIDVFDSLNADDIEKVIADLTEKKNDLNKMDLVVAEKYSKRTGKSISEILSLMKKGGWISAKEAKEWGFVDEIIETTQKPNYSNFINSVEKFDLPTNSLFETNFFTNNNSEKMKKQYKTVNELLNIETLESSDEGAYLNEDQISTINSKLEEMQNSIDEKDTEIANQKAKTTEVENKLKDSETKIENKDKEISNLKTQIENLKKNPGDETQTNVKETDGKEEPKEEDVVTNAKDLLNALPD